VTAQCCFSKQHLSLALKEMVKDCLCCLKTHLLERADDKEILYVRFQVLTAVLLKIPFFRDVLL
jgi:hypothetical protein